MYFSNTKEDRDAMLREIGVSSFNDLISSIPAKFLYPEFKFNEKPLNEKDLHDFFSKAASRNLKTISFVGAGAYERYVPAALKYLTSRGEFLTAYTPYQAEASQGILQTIYEYQSLAASLYGMDASNASMYDGATALAEAAKAAIRATGKNEVIYSSSLNPEYEKTLKTYLGNKYSAVKTEADGGTFDLKELKKVLGSGNAACVIIQNPNFFGIVENPRAIINAAHEAGALAVVSSDPLSLGLLEAPGNLGADLAVGEGQSLGLPLNYGGPYLGIFTCKKQYLRQMPGRIAGITKDKEGKRGFVLTLQAREQHIRRSRAASNICSNEALCALMAGIYLTLLGPAGLREAALLNHSNAVAALKAVERTGKARLKFPKPFFNEFVVDVSGNPGEARKKILGEEGIDIGLPLDFMGKGFESSLLMCATETKNGEDIAKLAAAMEKHL